MVAYNKRKKNQRWLSHHTSRNKGDGGFSPDGMEPKEDKIMWKWWWWMVKLPISLVKKNNNNLQLQGLQGRWAHDETQVLIKSRSCKDFHGRDSGCRLFVDGSVGIPEGSVEWGWGWLTKGGSCGVIFTSSDFVLRFFLGGLSVWMWWWR